MLQQLANQFPMEWFLENISPSVDDYTEFLQTLASQGAYDPEVMQRVFQTALAPGLELQRKGIHNLLGQQVAKGSFRPGTAAETAAKAMQTSYGEAWKQVPELALKDVQARMSGIEGLKGIMQAKMAPQIYQKGIAESLIGAGSAWPSGQTQDTPRTIWGIG